MPARKVLVVDDEATVRDVVARYLAVEGYDVASAADGAEGLRLARSWGPDLVVLDLMLPVMDGLAVCRTLRGESSVPIIMLTARGEEVDRIVGLEMGADDYLVKPFSPRELVARIKAIFRRTSQPDATPDTASGIRFAGLSLDTRGRSVDLEGKTVELTAKEFDLLHYLASNAGQVFNREQLMDAVWDYAYSGDASTVTVHIRRVREKIEADPTRPRFIKTVWGIGYKFEAPE
jgi:two-component system, OmpR family, response regulator VicR